MLNLSLVFSFFTECMLWDISPDAFRYVHKILNCLHKALYMCSESQKLTLAVLSPQIWLLLVSLHSLQALNVSDIPHVTVAFTLLSFSCLFLSSFVFSSSSFPSHHRCKVFIHMPAIPDHIPFNRTSVTAYTSACCLSLITAPQPSAQII